MRAIHSVKAQQAANDHREYAHHFVDSKANRGFKAHARRRANRLERHAVREMLRAGQYDAA